MRPTMPARCDTVVSSSSRRVACPAHTAKLHRCSSITDEFSTGVMDAHRENLAKSSLFERPPDTLSTGAQGACGFLARFARTGETLVELSFLGWSNLPEQPVHLSRQQHQSRPILRSSSL